MRKGFLFVASYALVMCPTGARGQDDTTGVVRLEEVVVSATRAGSYTPVAQTTLDSRAIEERRHGRDVPFLLELLPSVVGYSDNGMLAGSTSFRIRGSDASRINISIDGVPLNDAESQGVFWVNIPNLGAISQSLQVQRGVGTSAFGSSAFGGLLNIETAAGDSVAGGRFEASYGAFNTLNAVGAVATGRGKNGFSLDARYEYVQSDGYLEHSGMWQRSLFANAIWQGKNQRLKAVVLYGEQHSLLTYEGVTAESLASDRRHVYTDFGDWYHPDEADNYRQIHAHLHYTLRLTDRWTWNTTAYYIKGVGYYEQYKAWTSLAKYGIPAQTIDGVEYTKSNLIRRKGLDNDFYGINASAGYRTDDFSVTIGAGGNRYVGDHIGTVLWTQFNTGDVGYKRPWYDNTGAKEELNVFVKASWQFHPQWSVFADIQTRGVWFSMDGMDDDYYEKQQSNPSAGMLNERYSWLFVNPKAGLSYAPDAHHRAFLSVAIGNREPNRSDLKDADKNGIRTPATAERLYDFEGGYSYKTSWGAFGVNLYYMRYRNQIVSTGRLNDAYREIMENVPESYRTGFEITALVRPFRQWEIEAAFTGSRNKLQRYTHYSTRYDNPTDWNPVAPREEYFDEVTIAYSPSVVASGAIRWRPVKGLSVALLGKYVGKQFFDNTETDSRSLDGYFVNHLQVYYAFKAAGVPEAFVQLSVNNLFDQKYCTWAFTNDFAAYADGSDDYQDLRYFPQAGIHWSLKVGFKF